MLRLTLIVTSCIAYFFGGCARTQACPAVGTWSIDQRKLAGDSLSAAAQKCGSHCPNTFTQVFVAAFPSYATDFSNDAYEELLSGQAQHETWQKLGDALHADAVASAARKSNAAIPVVVLVGRSVYLVLPGNLTFSPKWDSCTLTITGGRLANNAARIATASLADILDRSERSAAVFWTIRVLGTAAQKSAVWKFATPSPAAAKTRGASTVRTGEQSIPGANASAVPPPLLHAYP